MLSSKAFTTLQGQKHIMSIPAHKKPKAAVHALAYHPAEAPKPNRLNEKLKIKEIKVNLSKTLESSDDQTILTKDDLIKCLKSMQYLPFLELL